MKSGYLLAGLLLVNTASFALFCPAQFKNITTGMTEEEVLAACGAPLSKQESNLPVQRKVPITQFYYNNQGAPGAVVPPVTPSSNYYGLYDNPQDIRGNMLQVDIVDNKVYGIAMDGTAQNAFSICNGSMVQIGDPVGKVYGACGAPLLTNKTFIIENLVDEPKPQIWIYQFNQFDVPARLTFVNGKLQSITQ